MPIVLITGGCGFLGATLARRARAAGHAVVAADVLPGADRALDARDPDAIAALVADVRPEVIVHLAAGLTDAGERDPVGTTRLNALGTAAVFAAAETNAVGRVIYATSISAVGPTTGTVGDDTRLAPGNVYGATKAFAEHLAYAMSARPGAPAYLGLRFGYVYGATRLAEVSAKGLRAARRRSRCNGTARRIAGAAGAAVPAARACGLTACARGCAMPRSPPPSFCRFPATRPYLAAQARRSRGSPRARREGALRRPRRRAAAGARGGRRDPRGGAHGGRRRARRPRRRAGLQVGRVPRRQREREPLRRPQVRRPAHPVGQAGRRRRQGARSVRRQSRIPTT